MPFLGKSRTNVLAEVAVFVAWDRIAGPGLMHFTALAMGRFGIVAVAVAILDADQACAGIVGRIVGVLRVRLSFHDLVTFITTSCPDPRHMLLAQRPVTVCKTNLPATVISFLLRQCGQIAVGRSLRKRGVLSRSPTRVFYHEPRQLLRLLVRCPSPWRFSRALSATISGAHAEQNTDDERWANAMSTTSGGILIDRKHPVQRIVTRVSIMAIGPRVLASRAHRSYR